MRGGSGKDRSGDRGQATVEFALVLPLLVLVVAGVIWVGQLMATQVQLENAAREGARAAAVEPDNAPSVAAAAAQRSMKEASTSARLDGDFVVVEVSIDVPGVPVIGVGSRTLTAVAHMRREDLIG